MLYTFIEVSESGSFSNPYPGDERIAHSKEELDTALSQWEYEHERVGSPAEYASLFVYKGCEVTDYPDFRAIHGPRGGFYLVRL